MVIQKPKVKFKGNLVGKFPVVEHKETVQSGSDSNINQEKRKEEGIQSEPDLTHNECKVITLWTGDEFHVFADHTLGQVQEWFLEKTLEEIKQIYLPHTYQWIEINKPDLELELREIEVKLESYVLSSSNYDEFKSLLQAYWRWHVKVLRLFKGHTQQFHSEVCDCPTCSIHVDENEFFLSQSNKRGGEKNMGIIIEAEKPIDPGVYEVIITKIDTTDGKYGKRLQITFELPDGRSVNGFFPPKATANNKTGRLFEKALGKLETADSDELIGKTVKVLIEHNEHNGRTYTNISKIL